jgi:hypothetical protein
MGEQNDHIWSFIVTQQLDGSRTTDNRDYTILILGWRVMVGGHNFKIFIYT